jgi:tetratricopeptide (TPR) repeat protein
VRAQSRATVSLCMIVRNEAHQLAECLMPVADLFDEIVIVDTGSRDDTAEVARRFTPHVFHFEWCDDFSAARNESLRHASGQWIFWLDADDRLSSENVARLKATLAALPSEPAAFMMDTACVPRDASDAERLITHPRLFWRHPELHWRGRVHEQVRPCPTTLDFRVVFSDVRIEHVGYQDGATRQRKLKRDVRLLRMDYAVDPDDPSTLLHLGQAYAEMGQADEAKKYLMRILSIEQRPLDYLRRVFATLCELALAQGRHQEVMAVADRALQLFPRDPHISYVLAEALYEVDRYKAAEGLLLEIINRPESPEYHAGAPGDIQRKLAPRSLGEVLRIQGAHAAAEAVLRTVVKVFPRETISWHALGRVYIDTGNRQKLDEVRASLAECPDGKVFSSLLLAAWCLLRGELQSAEAVIDELIAQAPQMPMPRLMRAEWLRRCGAPAAARLQACRDLLRVQPGNAQALQMVEQLEAAQRQPVVPPANSEGWHTSVVFGPGAAAGGIG